MTTTTTRAIDQVLDTEQGVEGEGFPVRRGLHLLRNGQLDPFLHLDELVRRDLDPGQAVGTGDHPHRGFETVTYLLEGAFVHRDSLGNGGRIDAGDAQWMTAGDGIVHSEKPAPEVVERGGPLWGFQLWVNLPAALKRTAPRYQSVTADRIPVVRGAGTEVRVIAGQHAGHRGPAETRTPITLLWVEVAPGSELDLDLPADHNVGVQAFAGSGWVGSPDRALAEGQLATFHREPGTVRLGVPEGSGAPLAGLVMAGRPLGEPVARYGPFVMSNRAELVEAFEDFQAGRMGAIPAT